jgi:hypothetical protein
VVRGTWFRVAGWRTASVVRIILHCVAKRHDDEQGAELIPDNSGEALFDADVLVPRAGTYCPMCSERWRFAGLVQVGSRRIAVLDGERGGIRIDYDRYCSLRGLGLHVCEYRDELITVDTGPAGTFIGSAIGNYAESFKSLGQ